MDIVVCIDRMFVMPSGVMMYSVCDNNREEDITFHVVVDESLTQNDKNDLLETISLFSKKKISFYTINSQLVSSFPIIRNDLTHSTYYRLFLTEILPNTLDKILYIDSDCIIRHSLLCLWETDIEGYAVAAVGEATEGDIKRYNRLHISPQIGYFNAGVLLINLKFWRKNKVLFLFSDCLEKYETRIQAEDQDILNIVFANQKLRLPVKYNLQPKFLFKECECDYWKYRKEIEEAKSDPVIVHFLGKDKPWDTYIREPHPFISTFYKYQNQTLWKGVKFERRPFKLRIRHFFADGLRRVKLKSPLKKLYIQNLTPID